jgi:hypothetical protein
MSLKEFGWWILDENHTPQFVGTGPEAFRAHGGKFWQRVAEDYVGPYRVSTVFLGIDHGFDPEGPPILFETMVFCKGFDEEIQKRYATWDEAIAGHQTIIRELESRPWTERTRHRLVAFIWRLKRYWELRRQILSGHPPESE